MKIKFFESVKTFYLIGAGGISMSAIADFLLSCGYSVSGSDRCTNERIKKLQKKGLKFYLGHSRENIADEEIIIYTDAINSENEEYLEGLKRGKLLISRAEFLNIIGKSFPHSVYVAGSHGKTTATCMIAHIFYAADMPFTAHIGGEDLQFGNFIYSGNSFFISEACEYNKNILKVFGETGILLDIDCDHMECYKDEKDVESTFVQFINQCKYSVVPFSSKIEKGDSFSYSSGDYFADDISSKNEKYSFTVMERGNPLVRVKLNVFGRHNILNALAAVACARKYGISPESIKEGLECFRGVKRRFEFLGKYNGADVYADYAHHPEEIVSSLYTAKRLLKRKLYVIFQPHTYSRTKFLMRDFVKSLEGERVLIFKTYPAREKYDASGDGKLLAKKINSDYAESAEGIYGFLSDSEEDDLILVLGAGDIYEIFKSLKLDV